MKKFITWLYVIGSVCLFFLCACSILNTDEKVEETIEATVSQVLYSEDEFLSYAYSSARNYLSNYDIQDLGTIYLSQGFQIIGNTDSNAAAFFVFQDEICIGELLVTYIDEKFESSFMYGEIPFITQAYLDRAAISFSTYNGALLMNKEDVTIDVFSQISYENFAGYLDINTCSATSKKSSIYLTKINEIGDFVFAVLSLSATNTVSLNFSIVRNSTSPDTGLGLFWAASIGSLAACYNNDTRYEYGAIIVYNIVKPIITL